MDSIPSNLRAQSPTRAVVLRVELMGVVPPVWRRVRVPARMSLSELHDVLQVVMGWEDRHLHLFLVGRTVVTVMSLTDLDLVLVQGIADEADRSVGGIAKSGISDLEYVYDFGDEWRHRVVVEATALTSAADVPM